MKLVLLAAFLTLPVLADWQRHVITPKGDRLDIAKPHSLSYFTRYPSLRDEDGNFCYLCPAQKRLELAKRQEERAKVRLIGNIRGYAVYDVLYYFGEAKEPDWKSILVRTQPGQYREIWHYQRNEGGIWPSFLVKMGQETLLGLADDCYRSSVIQEFFWFGKDGPIRVDFSPIWEAAQKAAPKDTRVLDEYDGFRDLVAGRLRVGLLRGPDWRCCSEGAVEVTFKLNDGRILVTGTRFDSNGSGSASGRPCR